MHARIADDLFMDPLITGKRITAAVPYSPVIPRRPLVKELHSILLLHIASNCRAKLHFAHAPFLFLLDENHKIGIMIHVFYGDAHKVEITDYH